MHTPRIATTALGILMASCGGTVRSDNGSASASETAGASSVGGTTSGGEPDASATTGPSETSATTQTTTSTSTSGFDDTESIKFDVNDGTGGESGGIDICSVNDDMDAMGPCDTVAPPDSFQPIVQWSWNGANGRTESITIALVANLTDDNGDGAIDLCDTPEVIVNAFGVYGLWDALLYALDGETGAVQWESETLVDGAVTPALGDIDDDGIAEIVAVQYSTHNLIAFENDGSTKWVGANWPGYNFGAIALADVDADGDVEIVAGNLLVDHEGTLLQTFPDTAGHMGFGNGTVAADLDEDGDLEIILGRSAYHHDGTLYYMQAGIDPGYPQVANLDADPQPEILIETTDGISMLEHDGTIKFQDLRPTGAGPGLNAWMRPSSIHDMAGDDAAEFAVSSQSLYAVYNQDATVVWTAPVSDGSGVAAGTAFDFLGDGTAEAMYADEQNLYIFDSTGTPLLTVPRSSGTIIEYPVVADVDNDGSAEIVVTSNNPFLGQTAPLVQVIRDVQDRWIQARRIWNQHTYHVTNVREDGTIPQVEPRHWQQLNTFRTNAQILPGGGVCRPEG